jgi:ABC-2 type transport system ATP-binding protein
VVAATNADLPRLVAELDPDGSGAIDEHTRRLTISADRGAEQLVEVVGRLATAGIGIADVALRRPTLDDVFLTLTGHMAEEPPPDEDETAGRRVAS